MKTNKINPTKPVVVDVVGFKEKAHACKCDGRKALLKVLCALMISASIVSVPFIQRDLVKGGMKNRPERPEMAERGGNMNAAIRDFIRKNPAFIIETVNAYYQAQQAGAAGGEGGGCGAAPAEPAKAGKPAAPAQARKADAAMIKEIVGDKTNHVLGNPKGSFVVIEFFDYQCHYCQMMNKQLPEAIKKSDNIRWVLIDSPIFGEKSELIAKYAYAAAKQGKYQAYHEALGDNKDTSEAGLIALGQTLGLDTAKLTKDAHSEAAAAKLAKNREYTKKLGMGGVPMFIIDGNIQGGAFREEQMNEYIKQSNAMKKK